jgi:hypothetical protein
MNTIYLGDIVEHTNSRRRGCVIEVGRTRHDKTTEYRVRPGQNDLLDIKPTWWNSAHLRRVPSRDPFRRYLALITIEDDTAKQELRQIYPGGHRCWARRTRTFGPWLPDAVWDQLYWRLRNQRRYDPSGAYVHYDLGREAWEKASIDCLERRDRAAHWWSRKTPDPSHERNEP